MRWLFVAAALFWFGATNHAVSAADRPNILWLTAEDMSATLGCWGDRYACTPHIDALAKESVKYTHVFATAPVCSPARSCLITGCYATTLGTQRLRSQFPIPPHIQGFPSYLRRTGYYCTNNVKTDYNTSNAPDIVARSWNECSKIAHWRNRPNREPFFAVFNHMVSHQSRSMVNPYEWFLENVQSKLPRDAIHDPDKAPVPPYYPDTPLIRKTVARYYDCVSAMDQEVGKLLDQLDEDGLADDTIVFFFSDHGSGMPRHKRALLDSGLHVPLLVRFPPKYRHLAPVPAGESVDRLISFVDFTPTILNLCQLEIPETMQGLPFLGADSAASRKYVYGARDRVDEAYDVARSIRDHRYLYIRNFMPHISYHQPSFYADQGEIRAEISRVFEAGGDEVSPALRHYAGPTRPVEELYDVTADPINQQNLAGDPKYRDVLVTMRRELRNWIFETRDLGFLTEEQMWAHLDGETPFVVGKDPERYPLQDLFRAASLVGQKDVNGRVLAEVVRGLNADEPGVRYWSTVALAADSQGSRIAEPALVKLLADPDPSVRVEAAGALARGGNLKKGLSHLVTELENPNPDVVLHAARTIELLGEEAHSAKAAMRDAGHRATGQGDQNMFIRFCTDAFLKRLGKLQ